MAVATATPKCSSPGSCMVRPATETPESTRARNRGTDAITCPPASASTSIEYSSPGRYSWTMNSVDRASWASSWLDATTEMSREPLPVRGLTTTG